MDIQTVFKYFVHGLLFSAVFAGLAVSGLDFIFTTVITVLLGLFLYGLINSLITSLLWKIPMKSDYWSFIVQGFILIFAFGGINLLFMLSLYPFLNNWITIVVVFLVQCIPYGIVAKQIAIRWEEEGETTEEVKRKWRGKNL